MFNCVECGSTRNVVEHHIQYRPERTVMVCASCHGIIHSNSEHHLHPVDEPIYKQSPVVTVHDHLHSKTEELADERGITKKEAVRDVFKEAGYDV